MAQGPLIASSAVSTTAEAPDRPATGETSHPATSAGARWWPQAAAFLIVAAALVAIPFVTGGGVDETAASPGNTWTEIALTLLGIGAFAASRLYAPSERRRRGLTTVGLMALLFSLTAASIAWSVAPDSSWLASGQMLAYLGVFGGGVALAQLAPSRWPVLLGGLTASAAALCAWSLVVKVFPASLAPGNTYGRLLAPFGYWNALALSAAMGLPGCLWLGARRDSGRRVAALAVPAMTLLISVLVLSYSRSADIAAIVAGGLWLVFVPLRLRAVAVLAAGAAGAAVISVWMLTHHVLSRDHTFPHIEMAAQDHAGHIFGIVVGVVLVVMTIAGFAIARSMDRVTIAAPRRRRIGAALLCLVGVVVIAAVGAVAASSRGLTGEISHGWHELTNSTGAADTAGRVLQFGSSRPVYWHEALAVGDHNVFKGVGALGFSVARLRYSTDPAPVFQAHSYVFETYADLGIIGLAVTAALLLAWLLATGRTLQLHRRRRALNPVQRTEREGLVTLAVIVVGFGVQSTLDWTWFFAGVSVPALLAAGWLVGHHPATDEPAPRSARRRRASALDRPGAVIAIPLLAAVALLGCWMVWRPLHSAQLVTAAENGDSSAFAAARSAHNADPLSLQPDSLLSTLYGDIHQPAKARAVLVHGTRVQPQNPSSWAALAAYDIQRHAWKQAIPSLSRVHALDRTTDPMATLNDAEIGEVFSHYHPPAAGS